MHQAASISIRTPGGIHFGTAGHIALTLLVVESPGVIEQDSELEFQLELPGLKDTVYGSAVVHHAEHFEDRPSSYEPVVFTPGERYPSRLAEKAGTDYLFVEKQTSTERTGWVKQRIACFGLSSTVQCQSRRLRRV